MSFFMNLQAIKFFPVFGPSVSPWHEHPEGGVSYPEWFLKSFKWLSVKACSHKPTPKLGLKFDPLKFNIVSMVTSTLMGRMDPTSILPARLPVSIDTMLNCDGDCNDDGHGVGMCKHTLKLI